ncbi:putative aldehyde dehydrogenase [Variovorax paradoxus B4]|uniref:4-(hydroxymethyl)benzenesulfonate dehydrogenase n=2 Tax=Variovorax paradoxus TaxID=34073 RepID=A0A0H2LUE4_VARPD|nr:aldehyde dehydrogenase family protein [Variovorax paradoxus]AGU52580.1 putative aldehyde dehydrogenase [Variovorax paradoxus B4]KLN53346.1 3-succinoylsemialdehyde-pyridine dehydrogenase [Variovorax paradoxus]
MAKHTQLFIDGAMVPAGGAHDLPVTDSFTEETFATYRTASALDVDTAVAAARRAFQGWAATPPPVRIAAVRRIAAALRDQAEALADAISREVGMPRKLAARIQVGAPIAAWDMYADLATDFGWESRIGHSLVQQVPSGIVACITPWNYPLHQITGKVAPALLAGCTVVLKPSELAPTSAFLLADAVRQAGLPSGVFNLVHGNGAEVGEALVRHPDVDMVSFTGSTRAGRHIAAVAGGDIKRMALELGGKSASLVLPGADLAAAVKATLAGCMLNSGQTCSATTRLLVPRASLEAAEGIAQALLAGYRMGDPSDGATRLGPLISKAQQQKVQGLIDGAIAAGARRVGVAADLPAHGFFVPPTVLAGVTPDMAVAQEEVFGPVLVLLAYDGLEDGIALANGTDYGLAGAVWGPPTPHTLAAARRLRAGQVDINGAPFNPAAPFGGFKKSGIGRENGRFGIEEFLEPVSIQLPAAFLETTAH